MLINAATERSLDLISQRASDVYKAFTPGALPLHDDVATAGPASRFDDDPMSASAPDDDYFVTSDGRGRTTYTRDGRLSIAGGIVTGSAGRPVLGYAGSGGTLQELKIDPIDYALGRSRNLRIEADGNIVYERRAIDPRTGESQLQRVIAGRLALARFPAATTLHASDDATFVAPSGVVPHIGRPGDPNFGSLSPMRREESRVDIDRSLERLHDAYVAFDALAAAHKAQGNTSKISMDLLK
jgi:flagellar basal body rod protein FlgG